jgi:hypothetical protein
MRPASAISRSLAAILVTGLLVACASEPPPAGFADAGTVSTAPTVASPTVGSADASAYDAVAPAPIGTTPNTVAAESQRSDMPPPLPPVGSTSSTSTAGGIAYPVTASFVPGYPDVLEVEIRDKEAASEVALVAPGGATIAAYQLDATKQVIVPQEESGVNFGVGVAGGSDGDVRTGIGIGFPIFGSAAPPRAETEVLTRARVRIADLAAYRADWQRWVLRVMFDAGQSTERKVEIVAPQPL